MTSQVILGQSEKFFEMAHQLQISALEDFMKKLETTISLPKLGMIAGTRGMLGTGIGLLISERINKSRRKIVGWTLLTIGVMSTIPLGLEVLRGRRVETSR
jgi:hypothetical protein